MLSGNKYNAADKQLSQRDRVVSPARIKCYLSLMHKTSTRLRRTQKKEIIIIKKERDRESALSGRFLAELAASFPKGDINILRVDVARRGIFSRDGDTALGDSHCSRRWHTSPLRPIFVREIVDDTVFSRARRGHARERVPPRGLARRDAEAAAGGKRKKKIK